jgi:hypothetical protein
MRFSSVHVYSNGKTTLGVIAHWIFVELSWTRAFQSWIAADQSCNRRIQYWISQILNWIGPEQSCKRRIQYWIQVIQTWIQPTRYWIREKPDRISAIPVILASIHKAIFVLQDIDARTSVKASLIQMKALGPTSTTREERNYFASLRPAICTSGSSAWLGTGRTCCRT